MSVQEQLNPSAVDRCGIESSPVWRGSFDFYRERGAYQIRIHIWGWPAKLLWRLLSPRWITRGYTPTPEGEAVPPQQQMP